MRQLAGLGRAASAYTTRRQSHCQSIEDVLKWSARQGHILTGDGTAERHYSNERGFAWAESELPHHHLLQATTRSQFFAWLASGRSGPEWVSRVFPASRFFCERASEGK